MRSVDASKVQVDNLMGSANEIMDKLPPDSKNAVESQYHTLQETHKKATRFIKDNLFGAQIKQSVSADASNEQRVIEADSVTKALNSGEDAAMRKQEFHKNSKRVCNCFKKK